MGAPHRSPRALQHLPTQDDKGLPNSDNCNASVKQSAIVVKASQRAHARRRVTGTFPWACFCSSAVDPVVNKAP